MEHDPCARRRAELAHWRNLLEECVFVIEGHASDYHFRAPPDLLDRLRKAIEDLKSATKVEVQE